MTEDTNWWLLVPRPLRRLPADLVAVVVLVLLTDIAALVPGISETPLRIVLGLPFVLFLPGYALIAALFPETGSTAAGDDERATAEGGGSLPRNGIDGIERVALSFGLSIAISPLIGLVLNFTPFGLRLTPIALAISGFTIVVAVLAAVRRWRLPPEERFYVPYRQWYREVSASVFRPETRMDAALNVVLVLSLLLAVSSVGYALATPKSGESFTELYLLTENESGALVADDYPRNLTTGGNESLVVGVGNHEHERMEYSLIVELQRVRFGANGSTRVLETERLQRFSPTVASNGTWQRRHQIDPTLTGERLRLTYLLYRGAPPGEPTIENAYREDHLWVNVSRPAQSTTA